MATSNPLVEFCFVNNFFPFIDYFKENQFDTLDQFRTKSSNLTKFYSKHTKLDLAPFINKLLKHNQNSPDTYPAADSHCIRLPIAEIQNSQENSDSQKQLTMFSINENKTFPFIIRGQFSIVGFEFPDMPDEFKCLNEEHVNEYVLRAITGKTLSKMFRDVCRKIWDVIKPAYPVNIPEIVIHEICAVFSIEYSYAQSNYEKILIFGVNGLNEKFVDIGKYLKYKFQLSKKSKSEAMKNAGTWVYQPGREGLEIKKRAKIQELTANRKLNKQSSNQYLEQIAELQKLNEGLKSKLQFLPTVPFEQSEDQTEDEASDVEEEENCKDNLKAQVLKTQTRSCSNAANTSKSKSHLTTTISISKMTRQTGRKRCKK